MKEIIEIRLEIFYKDDAPTRDLFDNIQDACSYLQTKKCYNKENRHK